MGEKKVANEFPPGWDEDRVRRVIAHYEGQADEAAACEDLRYFERLEDEIDIREVKKALADVEKNGTIPWAEVKKELGL